MSLDPLFVSVEAAAAAIGMNKMRLFLCLWAAVSEAEYLKYKDPKQPLNARIKDLMQRMTLEEKIGQMTQIERKVASPDAMKQYFIGTMIHFDILQVPIFVCLIYCNIEKEYCCAGSVLSGGGSVPKPNASTADWMEMVNNIQKAALSTRLGIPMIYGIDAVHGNNNSIKLPFSLTMLAFVSPGIHI